MVKALLDLNEETNKILNLVKAMHGFKDKNETIDFIVKRFKDVKEKATPEHLNDGDKWLLAEEIPDIDFFFSQIWLSCFVNEFSHPAGRPYKKILSIYKKYHLEFYYGENDAKEVGQHIVKKFLEQPSFAEEVNKKIIEFADKLSNYAKTLPRSDLDKLTNYQLWEIYNTHDKIHTEYYQWGWIPPAADMFHNDLTEALKGILREKSFSEEKLNEYFIILTQARTKSLIQIEQDEFLSLVNKISKNQKQKTLFEDLYKNFKEKEIAKFGYQTHTKEYEELLENKVGALVSQIDRELLASIRKHYEEYFYVNHMWVGKPFTLEHYIKEIVKLIGTHANISKMIGAAQNSFDENISKRTLLFKELKLEKRWVSLFDAFGDFMVTKIYRRFAQIYALYKMEFILEEIASRFNLSLMEVRFMLPSEVEQALIKNDINKEELKERTEFCVYYAEKDKDIIYTGKEAHEIATKARVIETNNVTELKGQVACMGKAKGRVKIIIRPADMSKMKEGDILVSIATDPDIVPAMKKAAAIVTEQGGVTSHAAIVSRELNIPCVIGTKIATKVLKDGDLVEVDANKGIVKILEHASRG